MGVYEEKLHRIEAAVALEDVDRIPVVSGNAAFNATACGVTLKDFINDMELNCTCNIEGVKKCGDVDGVQVRIASPYVLPGMWLSQVRVPGRELPDNELWQVLETELIQESDYDEILENGWEDWYNRYMVERLGDPGEEVAKIMAYGPTAKQRFIDAELPCIKEGNLVSPFEMLCGGRSLVTFMVDDLMEEPEKMDRVFQLVHAYNMEKYKKQFESPTKPYGVWVGGWRGTPSMLSPWMFDRFAWPYYRELVDLCIQYGVLPLLHLDSCWDRGLAHFRDFPAGKCVMALDGTTSMQLAKETVGDRMCIMGDVPAQMLAFAKPEEVHDYVTNLLRTMGPTGFILSSGCDVPYNAKLENVQMMTKARDDFMKKI